MAEQWTVSNLARLLRGINLEVAAAHGADSFFATPVIFDVFCGAAHTSCHARRQEGRISPLTALISVMRMLIN